MNVMNTPFVEAIKRHAKESPDKIAIATANEEVTYGNLYARIKGAAIYLDVNGIAKGDKIMLAAQKELGFVFRRRYPVTRR